MTANTRGSAERGAVVVITLIILMSIALMVSAFLVLLGKGRGARILMWDGERGLALAEAGVEKAIWELSQPGQAYRGETDTRFGDGFFTVAVTAHGGTPEAWTITATGRFEEDVTARRRRPSSVPRVTARVEINRGPHGGAKRLSVVDWKVEPQPAPTSRPASRPI